MPAARSWQEGGWGRPQARRRASWCCPWLVEQGVVCGLQASGSCQWSGQLQPIYSWQSAWEQLRRQQLQQQ